MPRLSSHFVSAMLGAAAFAVFGMARQQAQPPTDWSKFNFEPDVTNTLNTFSLVQQHTTDRCLALAQVSPSLPMPSVAGAPRDGFVVVISASGSAYVINANGEVRIADVPKRDPRINMSLDFRMGFITATPDLDTIRSKATP